MFCSVALLTAAWEWNARVNVGLPRGRHRRQPAGVGGAKARPQISRRWRSSATAASCSIPTRRRFQALTGVRPVQVAHVGTDARALLEHFANDPKFHGLLIVGMADTMYFGMPVIGLGGTVIL